MTRRSIGLLAALVGTVVLTAGAPSPAFAQTAAPVTVTKDVLPILQRSCQSCHRAGAIAPMSLMSYADVRPWARSIKRYVVAREMPPWYIDRRIGIQKFKDDPSLTDAEIATIAAWVDAGFRVRLPHDWDQSDELVWAVTAHGKTDRAIGLLLPLYELSPLADGNTPPTLQVDHTSRRISFPDTVTLLASVSDDGKPENLRDRASVRWVHYWGPGRVTFEPVRSPIPADTETVADVEVATTATFSEPGTFVLRVVANDGTANRAGNPVIPSTTHALMTVEVEF